MVARASTAAGDTSQEQSAQSLGRRGARGSRVASSQAPPRRRADANAGGLMSYSTGSKERYRVLGDYADRILKGEKAGDLPVQLRTKFEMVVNRRTAAALGLAIPPSILLRADEVIE
jgi:hypothetical protein